MFYRRQKAFWWFSAWVFFRSGLLVRVDGGSRENEGLSSGLAWFGGPKLFKEMETMTIGSSKKHLFFFFFVNIFWFLFFFPDWISAKGWRSMGNPKPESSRWNDGFRSKAVVEAVINCQDRWRTGITPLYTWHPLVSREFERSRRPTARVSNKLIVWASLNRPNTN